MSPTTALVCCHISFLNENKDRYTSLDPIFPAAALSFLSPCLQRNSLEECCGGATSLPPLLSLTVSSPEAFVLNALLGVSLSCQIHQPILFLSDFLYSIWHPLLETPFLLALGSCCLASCSFLVFFTSSIDFNVALPSAFSSFYFVTLSASVISTSLMATNNTCILTIPKYVS